MRAAAVSIALCAFFLTAVVSAGPEAGNPRVLMRTGNPRVLMRTGVGDIIVEIDVLHAPITAANFLAYVDRGLFDGASFYRVVRPDNQPGSPVEIEVIQGGLGFAEETKALAPISHETTDKTGIHHKDGTISMARGKPGSAASEFFICINDQPELDFMGQRNPDGRGFAAFGRVVQGMDVVRSIQRRRDRGQMLIEPVTILSVTRIN